VEVNGSTDTLAYYKTATITALKSFIVQATIVEHLNTGVAVANSLDYFDETTITAVKSFIVLLCVKVNSSSTMVEHLNTDLKFWGLSPLTTLHQG
jgi:hypothetical protein